MKSFAFGKDKSEITKGVAILMMMWLHTFGTEQSIGCYTSFWNIGGGISRTFSPRHAIPLVSLWCLVDTVFISHF